MNRHAIDATLTRTPPRYVSRPRDGQLRRRNAPRLGELRVLARRLDGERAVVARLEVGREVLARPRRGLARDVLAGQRAARQDAIWQADDAEVVARLGDVSFEGALI